MPRNEPHEEQHTKSLALPTFPDTQKISFSPPRSHFPSTAAAARFPSPRDFCRSSAAGAASRRRQGRRPGAPPPGDSAASTDEGAAVKT
jgi:hypothetical protein